jgi:hypothetical protein
MQRVVIAKREETEENGQNVKKDISFRNRTVPNKTVFDVELYGLADKIKDIKLENRQYELVTKIQSILDLFDVDENVYNEKLLLFAMQAVENYIIKSKSGEKKLAVVVECVEKYFKGDIQLIMKMVELLLPKVKKMNIFRRNWKRVGLFFFDQQLKDVSTLQ